MDTDTKNQMESHSPSNRAWSPGQRPGLYQRSATRWTAIPQPNLPRLKACLRIVCLGAVMGLLAGCGTFRWGERDNLDDITSTKAQESHAWPGFKPDRDLQDPLWTP